MPEPIDTKSQTPPTVTDVALGLKSNTLAQYGILGILAIAGPWLWNQAKEIHTTAVTTSADRFEKAAKTAAEVAKLAEEDRKQCREQFTAELKTILTDCKSERKEYHDMVDKSSERQWSRLAKFGDAIQENTKEQKANTVEQHNLVVELREERHREGRQPPPAKAAMP